MLIEHTEPGNKIFRTRHNQEIRVFDAAKFEASFERSEVRSMSKLSLVMRSLATDLLKKIASPLEPERTGIYIISNAGENYAPTFDLADKGTPLEAVLNSIPPKHLLGLPSSMVIYNIAVALGSSGPILSFYPTLQSPRELIEEIRLHNKTQRIGAAVIGLCLCASDPLEALPNGLKNEIAYLAFCDDLADEPLSQIEKTLNSLLFLNEAEP